MDDKRTFYLEAFPFAEEKLFRRCKCIKILEKQVSLSQSVMERFFWMLKKRYREEKCDHEDQTTLSKHLTQKCQDVPNLDSLDRWNQD